VRAIFGALSLRESDLTEIDGRAYHPKRKGRAFARPFHFQKSWVPGTSQAMTA
jgi:hypothetical protein